MEQQVIEFLKRIIQTISLILLWLLIDSTAGIMYGHGFFDNGITLGNILFYIWLLSTGTALFIYLKRKWKEPFDFYNNTER